MNPEIDQLRERVATRGYAEIPDVEIVERAAAEAHSAELLILLGDLIQILEVPGRYRLSDAESAYLRALEIDPSDAEAHESLGYFYDAVMDDPQRAKPFFERAIALGSSEAKEGLADVLRQLEDR